MFRGPAPPNPLAALPLDCIFFVTSCSLRNALTWVSGRPLPLREQAGPAVNYMPTLEGTVRPSQTQSAEELKASVQGCRGNGGAVLVVGLTSQPHTPPKKIITSLIAFPALISGPARQPAAQRAQPPLS
ncbi:unnamed protein product [Arctogadus glacialis]